MNPYQQNLNIMKSFFRKPIVLVYAIVTLSSVVTTMISGFVLIRADVSAHLSQFIMGITQNILSELNVNVDLDTIATASRSSSSYSLNIDLLTVLIGLAFVFFYTKSKSANPMATLKAPTVMFRIYAIFTFVCSIIAVTFGMIGVCVSVIFIPSFAWLLAITVPSFVYLLLYGISIFLFSGSIKNNQRSIYLSNRGAAFFGIMSIIGAVVSLCSSAATSVIFINSGVDTVAVVLMNVLGIVPVASSVILGIIALSYSSYIKKLSEGFVYDPVEQAEQTEQPLFCGNCGQQLNPDDYFCNHCGTPVKR